MNIDASNLMKARIHLKWFPNAAFDRIFVANEKSFFAVEGIDVEIIPRTPGTNVDELIASGFADFSVSSIDSAMQSQQRGLPIVSIAQIFQGSSYFKVIRD